MVGSFNWSDVKMVSHTVTLSGCGRGGFEVEKDIRTPKPFR